MEMKDQFSKSIKIQRFPLCGIRVRYEEMPPVARAFIFTDITLYRYDTEFHVTL